MRHGKERQFRHRSCQVKILWNGLSLRYVTASYNSWILSILYSILKILCRIRKGISLEKKLEAIDVFNFLLAVMWKWCVALQPDLNLLFIFQVTLAFLPGHFDVLYSQNQRLIFLTKNPTNTFGGKPTWWLLTLEPLQFPRNVFGCNKASSIRHGLGNGFWTTQCRVATVSPMKFKVHVVINNRSAQSVRSNM